MHGSVAWNQQSWQYFSQHGPEAMIGHVGYCIQVSSVCPFVGVDVSVSVFNICGSFWNYNRYSSEILLAYLEWYSTLQIFMCLCENIGLSRMFLLTVPNTTLTEQMFILHKKNKTNAQGCPVKMAHRWFMTKTAPFDLWSERAHAF